jgi:hypothetical protein
MSDVDIERRHFELAHQLARPAIKAVRKSRDSHGKGRVTGPKSQGSAKSA